MRLTTAILTLAVACGMLAPADSLAHNSEHILAKVSAGPAGDLRVELTVDYAENPLIKGEEAAAKALRGLLLLREGDAVRALGDLGEWRFEKRIKFDPASPLPKDPNEHDSQLLTALWHGKLSSDSFRFEIPKEDKSSVVLWNAGDSKNKWLFLMAGDQSPLITFPMGPIGLIEPIDFARDVRPILAQNCFTCHGPDDKARKSGLRLDLRDAALKEAKSGAVAIVPGKPDESELLLRVFSEDKDEIMPPPSTKHELTAAQKEILKRWVASGAEYKAHWAFIAPKPADHTAANSIDSLIRTRLAKEALKPAAEADPYTLIRRLHLDLIGLPPTPDEADAFATASALDPQSALEALADRLLASPHYGERWARKWLDLARYADTNGYEKDRTRTIWPYRDWVVRALNADLPFDQFTIAQLAGDLLANATQDQLIATGFHRNTMLNEEGGIDPLEFRFHAVTDRLATTGTTWLGLTTGCAQCHTHKFDPILHTEYYQMLAFLNNADEPELELESKKIPANHERNLVKAAELLAQLPEKWPIEKNQWQSQKPAAVSTAHGETPKMLEDGSALFAAPGPAEDTYSFVIESDTASTQLRLEALTDPTLPAQGPGRVRHGNFILNEIVITAAPKNKPDEAVPVKIISAEAAAQQRDFPIKSAFDGDPKSGWAVDAQGALLNAPKSAIFRFEKKIGFPEGTRYTVKLVQSYGAHHTMGRVRISLGAEMDDARLLAQRREDALQAAFTTWLEQARSRPAAWQRLRPVSAKSNSPLLTIQPDDSVLASGDITKDDRYELVFRQAPAVTALRLEAIPDASLPNHGPGMAYYEGPKGDFFMGEFQVFAGGKQLKIARASESYSKNAMGESPATAALATDGDPETGWSCSNRFGEAHQSVFVLADPLPAGTELTVTMRFGRHYACSLGRFRLSATADPRGASADELPKNLDPLRALPDAQLSADQRKQLRDHFLLTAPQLATDAARIRELHRPPRSQTTLVMKERPPQNPRPTFLHNRGEYLQPKERIEPGVPAFLPPLPAGVPRNRLTFAKWLVAPENPLTARVIVNRQWAAFFGEGLVRTPGDFGFQGELPSHPELLDYLALEFQNKGWSLKKLHRLIVTSATYRQSSDVSPEALGRDPQNRLLARGARVRVDAEVVRDIALQASGLLSGKMFGPPVYPPQPAGVTETAFGEAGWEPSMGEERYRRALYTFAKRSTPFALFNTFDGPTGEVCVARREVSNTPLQSLTLLNDEMFLEMAQKLGSDAAAIASNDEQKAAFIFRRCLTRPPKEKELASMLGFVRIQRDRIARGELKAAELAPGEGDPSERAAWTTLARAVLNLDETITKH